MYLIQCKLKNNEEWPSSLPNSLLDLQTISALFETSSQSVGPYLTPKSHNSFDPKSTSPAEKLAPGITMGSSGNAKPWKVVILGDQVGKSSLLIRFIFNEFSEHADETVEDHYTVTYTEKGIDYHFHFLDTAGSDIYYDNMASKVTFHSHICIPIGLFKRD